MEKVKSLRYIHAGPAYQLPAKFPSFVFLRGLPKKAVVEQEEDSF